MWTSKITRGALVLLAVEEFACFSSLDLVLHLILHQIEKSIAAVEIHLCHFEGTITCLQQLFSAEYTQMRCKASIHLHSLRVRLKLQRQLFIFAL